MTIQKEALRIKAGNKLISLFESAVSCLSQLSNIKIELTKLKTELLNKNTIFDANDIKIVDDKISEITIAISDLK